MKRIPLMFLAITIWCLGFGQRTETKEQQQSKVAPDANMQFVSPFKGWVVRAETLQDYDVGIDTQTKHGGKASAFARSKTTSGSIGVCVLRQSIMADQFRDERVRLSGWLKSENITEWAGFWLRIDGEQGVRLSLDNMQGRPIKGTGDWRRFELVLNVPHNALAISFGLVLVDKGQIWMDDLSLERAPAESLTTERYGRSAARPADDEYVRRREALAKRLLEELKAKPLEPVNLDFENTTP
jgi:hypothetical protein